MSKDVDKLSRRLHQLETRLFAGFFFLNPDQFPVGTYRMGVLSLDAAFKAIPEIPEGALLVVVRQNNPYNPVWITHLGFVVRHSENDVRIRHATKMGGGVVKEH